MDIRIGDTLNGAENKEISIDSVLGNGGMGQVFAGTMSDGTRVAVKTVLTSSLNDDELKALQNEANLAKDINHPNVVQILHVSTGENETGLPPYIVMEFVDGGTLRSVIEAHQSTGSKPEVNDLRGMYLQIADGMGAINEKVVHRDLKPENILIDNATGQLKIADFGLAKLTDAATRSETFKGWGTRPYQAPEAFEQGPNTVAMDIYAGGVTFFELATLTFPIQPRYGDDGPIAWRNAHLLTPPSDARISRSDLPNSIVQLFILMLQKDPKRRPQNWAVVIDRLRHDEEQNEIRVDVRGLVQKATQSLLEQTEQETNRRAETEKIAERNALLEQTIQEPINILQELVDAFNSASDVGKLILTDRDNSLFEVTGPARGKSLIVQTKIISDLSTQNEIYRVLAIARIIPMPVAPKDPQLVYSQDSFGSFNLGYKVTSADERFGTWNMLRFEHNPLMGKTGYPHWFAMDLDELPRQLSVLNALGIYQNQQRALDHEWFRLLLAHLL